MVIVQIAGDSQLQLMLSAERPRLTRLCAYLVGDADAAEDLAQETLFEAWRHIDRLRDPDAFSPWLSGIARNVCARWLRAHGRETARVVPLDDVAPARPDELGVDFEAELERGELAALLDRALELLPAETRTLLIQRYVAESPHAAIAETLGLSENVVAVRLHRGRLALRRLLTTELRAEAEALDLIGASDGWQETRIWCTECGQQRLRGRFTADEFVLRCPQCCAEPGVFHSQASVRPLLDGLKGFRPALSRCSAWMDDLFRGAVAAGRAICRQCGHPTPLHLHLPASAPPSVRARRGMHVRCEHCGAGSYESLDGFALNSPAGRRFWREHPRIRTLPQRELTHQGAPAIVISFESVSGPAAIDFVVHRDSYALLAGGGRDER